MGKTNRDIKPADAKHLKTFLEDYKVKNGYIVCRCSKRRKLDDQITAIPWQEISELLFF